MLHKIEPRAWLAANKRVEAVLAHDLGLHLPYDIPNDGPRQPSVFSRVKYRFTTGGSPRRETVAHARGFTALTSMGNYDSTEGELILWDEERVINFPTGSTFLLPKWMRHSFTAVKSPGYQMILAQSCEGALWEYISNNFSTAEGGPETRTEESCMRIAQAAASECNTLREFDSKYERGLHSR
jgi:hypothetical protein